MFGNYHVTLKDLLNAGILISGEEVHFKNATAVICENGNLNYENKEYTSLSNWAKEIASCYGLSKHYNGWKVVYVKRFNRPLAQFREKYILEKTGKVYEFPPLETKKRKRTSPLFEILPKIESPEKIDDSLYGESSTDTEHSKSTELDEDSDISGKPHKCGSKECYVCEQLGTSFVKHSPTWSDILQVVLYSLSRIHKGRQYFSLGEEIYTFVDSHWEYLSSKPKTSTWRQTAKMTLAHNRYSDLFENGYDVMMKTGFWRLKSIKSPAINGSSPSKKIKTVAEFDSDYSVGLERATSIAASALLDVKNLATSSEKKNTKNSNPVNQLVRLSISKDSETDNQGNLAENKTSPLKCVEPESPFAEKCSPFTNVRTLDENMLLNQYPEMSSKSKNEQITLLLEKIEFLRRQVEEERNLRLKDHIRAYNAIKEKQKANVLYMEIKSQLETVMGNQICIPSDEQLDLNIKKTDMISTSSVLQAQL